MELPGLRRDTSQYQMLGKEDFMLMVRLSGDIWLDIVKNIMLDKIWSRLAACLYVLVCVFIIGFL